MSDPVLLLIENHFSSPYFHLGSSWKIATLLNEVIRNVDLMSNEVFHRAFEPNVEHLETFEL